MACGPKITLGIQRCPRPQSPYSAQHVYISDAVQTVYELTLLPNNSEKFVYKSVAVRSVDWIFIVGAPVWR